MRAFNHMKIMQRQMTPLNETDLDSLLNYILFIFLWNEFACHQVKIISLSYAVDTKGMQCIYPFNDADTCCFRRH